jgi:two-component system, response regulator PdtaR
VFDQDAKTIQRMAPLLQRVLIVDPQPASAGMIGGLMRQVSRPEIWIEPTSDRAMKTAAKVDPQIIFADLAAESLDGVAFTRRLRRSDLDCRKTPVVLVTGQATAATILAARDAGVHEFLCKPFTVKDLLRRLEAVTLRPRGWVEAVAYVGPDRRRFNSGDYKGALKRHADAEVTPEFARIGQALKILRSAVAAIEQDPAQAMRSMLAQTTDLQVAAAAVSDHRLAMASGALHRYLFETASAVATPQRAELERHAAPLLAHAPRYGEDRDAVAA